MRADVPSKKKVLYPVSQAFKNYLADHNRFRELPLQYKDLLLYSSSATLFDFDGNDTHWSTVFYDGHKAQEVNESLTRIYTLLKADGDEKVLDHLSVSRIDYCEYGNTQPFRVRILNKLNDNFDHFYVKRIDASRLYGLELEDLLSPNRVTYLVDKETIIEEHIAGVPGDDFMKHHLEETEFNKIRIAKEFVKFNERCFVRLLGDMRSYNYVVDITPDIEGKQYRLRPIDFDQQSYEGRKSFYLPQYFKDNNPIIFMGIKHMQPDTVRQYQLEERSLIAARVKNSRKRINLLFSSMVHDEISSSSKIRQLRMDLHSHHNNPTFLQCRTMGEIVLTNLQLLLSKDFKQSIYSPAT